MKTEPGYFQWCPVTGPEVRVQTETQVSPGQQETLWRPSTDCPGKLLSLCLWRYSRVICTQSQAACSRWLCLRKGFGPNDFQRSLPSSTILQFCDIHSLSVPASVTAHILQVNQGACNIHGLSCSCLKVDTRFIGSSWWQMADIGSVATLLPVHKLYPKLWSVQLPEKRHLLHGISVFEKVRTAVNYRNKCCCVSFHASTLLLRERE